MDFEFTMVGRVAARDEEQAWRHLKEAVRQLDNYSPQVGVLFTEVGFDLKQIPQAQLAGERASRVSFTEMMETGQVSAVGPLPTLPDDHPWNRGVFIFPEDHSLARLERSMYARWKAGEDVADAPEVFLSARKALGPGGE